MIRKVINNSSKILKEALTFDDVLLVPRRSNFIPREAETKTKFSRNISINIPLISAAMDSLRNQVIATQEGGKALYKNLIEEQARGSGQVKRSESG